MALNLGGFPVARAVLDLHVFLPWLGQVGIGFRSLFDRPWFAPERPGNVPLGGDEFEQLGVQLDDPPDMMVPSPVSRLPGKQQFETALEADSATVAASTNRGALRHRPHEIVGDQHHAQRLARHRRTPHLEALHPQRGLEIAQLDLDFPSRGIEDGQVCPFVGFGIEQRGDENHLALLPTAILVAEADVTHGQGVGQGFPCLLPETASGRDLRGLLPLDQPLVPPGLPALAPVERAVTGVMEAHEAVGEKLPGRKTACEKLPVPSKRGLP